MSAIIKNIKQDTVLPFAGEVTAQPGQIVSKTLAQNQAVSITLFAFSKGEEISTHDISSLLQQKALQILICRAPQLSHVR